jgi:hypothetical protein
MVEAFRTEERARREAIELENRDWFDAKYEVKRNQCELGKASEISDYDKWYTAQKDRFTSNLDKKSKDFYTRMNRAQLEWEDNFKINRRGLSAEASAKFDFKIKSELEKLEELIHKCNLQLNELYDKSALVGNTRQIEKILGEKIDSIDAKLDTYKIELDLKKREVEFMWDMNEDGRLMSKEDSILEHNRHSDRELSIFEYKMDLEREKIKRKWNTEMDEIEKEVKTETIRRKTYDAEKAVLDYLRLKRLHS